MIDLSTVKELCAGSTDNHHVVLKGKTGAGKSYIANALGAAACRQLYKVRYIHIPDLLELIDVCSRKGALIRCTQYDVDDWYYRIDCDRAEEEGSAAIVL